MCNTYFLSEAILIDFLVFKKFAVHIIAIIKFNPSINISHKIIIIICCRDESKNALRQ